MAHKKGLDGTYLQPTLEEYYKEFFKVISDLTIDDNERLRIRNNVLEKEKSELEKSDVAIKQLKKKLVKAESKWDNFMDNLMEGWEKIDEEYKNKNNLQISS